MLCIQICTYIRLFWGRKWKSYTNKFLKWERYSDRHSEEMIKIWITSSQRWGLHKAPAPFLAGGGFPMIQVQDGSLPLPWKKTVNFLIFFYSYTGSSSGPKRKRSCCLSSMAFVLMAFVPYVREGKGSWHYPTLYITPGLLCLKPGHREVSCGLLLCPQSFPCASVEIGKEEPANCW